MNTARFLSTSFLALFLFCPAAEVFAASESHQHKEENAEELTPPAMDSMYSVKANEPLAESFRDDFDDVFSPTDLFTADELASPASSAAKVDMEMAEGRGEHAGHQEPQVELSDHERVSSSSKGFGIAVGITLFAGVVFAGLTFLRLGE